MPAPFTPASLKFLRALKRNNDREWFSAHKPAYESDLKQPLLALIAQLNESILAFAPQHVRPPQKIIMRIYRDTRFSHDKTPYKKHVAAWWAHDGMEKTSGGGFYFHFGPTEVVIAAGVYMPDRDQLLAIRRHIAEHHLRFRKLLADKKLRAVLSERETLRLTRAPKGFPPDHPAIDLLLHRQWGFGTTLPAEAALSPTLAAQIIDRFRAAAPIVAFLNEPLITNRGPQRMNLFTGADRTRRKPLFGLD